MTISPQAWRERPLKREPGRKGDSKLLDALVEAWNRELSPLLGSLRQGVIDAFGVTREVAFADSPYTVVSNDKLIRVDASGGAVVVNLREASKATTNGVQYLIVKKLDSSGNAVTVTGNGTEDIDGANEAPLTSQYASIELWPRVLPSGGYDIA